MTRRCLVLSAGMGAGHDAVAAELARRLRARGHPTHVHDVLALLPPAPGPPCAPSTAPPYAASPLYAAVYRVFLAPPPARPDGPAAPHADTSPLAALAERPCGP